MHRWESKVAIVTGASSGIGKAIAEHLVHSGLQVVGLARRKERCDEIAKNLKGSKGTFYALKADVTKEEDIINAFKWVTDNVGIVHILVNNAGVCRVTNLIDGDTTLWKETLDTNLLGLCIGTREAIKIMRANQVDGHIIHINSTSGHSIVNLPHLNVYPATKYGVTALTETLRKELNSIGSKIKITSISPGFVKTEIVEMTGYVTDDTTPILLPEDIAEAVQYVLGTPPHVQVHELIIKPVGDSV